MNVKKVLEIINNPVGTNTLWERLKREGFVDRDCKKKEPKYKKISNKCVCGLDKNISKTFTIDTLDKNV